MSNDATPTTLSDGLGPLDDNEECPARLWAEIHRLRAQIEGPAGHESWQAAAVAEGLGRKQAQQELQKDARRHVDSVSHVTVPRKLPEEISKLVRASHGNATVYTVEHIWHECIRHLEC